MTRNPDVAGAEEVRLLGSLLMLFAAVQIVVTAIGYLVPLAAADGQDPSGTQTLASIPALFYFVMYFVSARRLRRLEPEGRRMVTGLSWLGVVVSSSFPIVAVLVAERPNVEIAVQLWLLAHGGLWSIVFPALALLRLRRPEIEEVFEPA
jgi:hypothetical protein